RNTYSSIIAQMLIYFFINLLMWLQYLRRSKLEKVFVAEI
ncbi:MAG: hypothetical protein ACI9RO_000348, partial [Alteromonas macleodii]